MTPDGSMDLALIEMDFTCQQAVAGRTAGRETPSGKDFRHSSMGKLLHF